MKEVNESGDALKLVSDLHRAYCRLTGFDLPMSYDRQAAWFEWVRRKFTVDDLEQLIKHHQWLAKNGLPARSLKFRSIVVSIDFAEEDIAEIRARSRCKPINPNKEEVLKATGRVPPDGAMEPTAAMPSKEIVASAIEQLKKAAGIA